MTLYVGNCICNSLPGSLPFFFGIPGIAKYCCKGWVMHHGRCIFAELTKLQMMWTSMAIKSRIHGKMQLKCIVVGTLIPLSMIGAAQDHQAAKPMLARYSPLFFDFEDAAAESRVDSTRPNPLAARAIRDSLWTQQPVRLRGGSSSSTS